MKSWKPFSALKFTRPQAQMKLTEDIIHSGSLACNLPTDLFNAIVTTGHIPTVFQLGYITPISKDLNKDQTDPSNYRGISLLANISKLFEKVILAKLQSPT